MSGPGTVMVVPGDFQPRMLVFARACEPVGSSVLQHLKMG